MTKQVALRLILALAVSFAWACAPRLDQQQVRASLLEQLQLQGDQLRVVSLTSDTLPVATIEYGGVGARVRFRRQDRAWVIDAVGQDGGWEPAGRALPVFGRQLVEKARAKWIGDVMPRYARTLKLLVGWTELLSAACGSGLPTSQKALIDIHAAWHRTLFPNRGGEFHNVDLFVRDAWWKLFKLTLTVARVEVQSSGADGRMDTPDDVRLLYTRTHIRRDVEACVPHYTMPTFVVDALGRADAPAQWNCATLLSALKTAEMLDLVQAEK